MSSTVLVVLLAWVPLVLALFLWLPPRRAVLVAFLFAWLFLPMAKYPLAGLPDYTKMSATTLGIFLAALMFDTKRLLSFQLRWIDLPMVIWCLCPIASSLANNLGLYNGMSASLNQFITWGAPYFIGRVYFTDQESVRELAIGLFIGGLVYIPFCIYEIRMSPQLHTMVYGFHQHSFGQTMRFGGWRPMVFMQHGLMVGMWMAMASLVGCWLWMSGVLVRLWNIPIWMFLVPLVGTTILCKSVGALLLLAVGLIALVAIRWLNTRLVVLGLILIPPTYIAARVSDLWDGSEAVAIVQDYISVERAQSLQFRLDNETVLIGKAMQQPLFGWSGWGRNRVRDEFGKDQTTTDGLWIITLGTTGMLGLSLFFSALLIPSGYFWLKAFNRNAFEQHAPAVAMSMVTVLYAIDCLQNGMINPVFVICLGVASSMAVQKIATTQQAETAPLLASSGTRFVGRKMWPAEG